MVQPPLLCMGAQASIVLEPFSWLSRVAPFTQRREPISPVSVGWVAMNQSHMCGLWIVFIVTYLSFREVKPRVRESRCLYTQGSEAVLKVQLQRRAGKNHVWLNWQSRVWLKVVRLHNIPLLQCWSVPLSNKGFPEGSPIVCCSKSWILLKGLKPTQWVTR